MCPCQRQQPALLEMMLSDGRTPKITATLHLKKSGSEVVQGQGGVITSPTLLGPVSVRRQQS